MIGLLYVENETSHLLAKEISEVLGGETVFSFSIQEESTKGNLTPLALEIRDKLSKADSSIVIVDDVNWDTFWKEELNKIHNKLEELILDKGADLNFILVVGINIKKVKEFHEYLSCPTISSKVCRMQESSNDISSELDKIVAKRVVDTFQTAKRPSSTQKEDSVQNPKAGLPNTSDPSEIDFTVPSTSRNDEDIEEDDCYTLQSPGLCFYIGVLEFSPDSEDKLNKRHSSVKELKKIKDSFEELGCFVKEKRNPTKQEADIFLKEGIRWCEKLKPSFVALIISTHGLEAPAADKENPSSGNPLLIKGSEKETTTEEMVHQLFMYDGEILQTKTVVEMFRDCISLSDKPCLFFIQACRSRLSENENVDPGVIIPSYLENGKSSEEEQLKPGLKDAQVKNAKDFIDAMPIYIYTKYPKGEAESKVYHAKKLAILGYQLQCQLENKMPTAPQENLKDIQNLKNALDREGFLLKDIEQILGVCQGYEAYILDYFYPKAVIFYPSPCLNDDLVMFASPPGKYAYNRESEGGWLISNLEAQINETLDQKPEKIDLLAELTKVSDRIAREYETETDNPEDSGHKSVPCVYHTLTKDIIIWPEQMKNTKELAEQDPQWRAFLQWNP